MQTTSGLETFFFSLPPPVAVLELALTRVWYFSNVAAAAAATAAAAACRLATNRRPRCQVCAPKKKHRGSRV
jgi:hypothetical protein